MNFKNIILIFIFSLFCIPQTDAQKLLSVKKSEFVTASDKSPLAYSKIKKAIDLFEEDANSTDQCIALFLEAYKNNKGNAELNYNLGICYLFSNQKEKSTKYLETAYQLNPMLSKDLCFYIGLSYQYRSEFNKAIELFNKNIENEIKIKGEKNKNLIELCEKHINECRNGIHLQSLPASYSISLLNDKVNSRFNDLNPVKVDHVFYFSSQRKLNSSSKSIEKVYSVSTDQDGFQDVKIENIPFDEILNVALVDCIGNNTFAFYAGIDNGGDIYTAEKKDNKWTAVKAIKGVNTLSSREASACIAGNELYFVSDRSGSYGACDIFFCTKIKGGNWSVPKNIGLHINTPFDEADVFVTKDGKELFFNSKGHNSMGGYDIFKCERLQNGGWSDPVNMGAPVNSPYNDIQYFKSDDGEAFFSSERGAGGYDIYSTAKIVKPAKETLLAKEKPAPKKLVPQAPKQVAPELIYRIQILACKNAAPAEELYKIYSGNEVIAHQFLSGWHKYAIGQFKTYRKAEQFKDSCGVSGAFIVLFKNGEPIDLSSL
ncbi:hypothetical protein ACT3CE_17790 [Marinifilum sp. RC60d5]|uniref:hypothetical protein n=1 Tax=Marinifilum sp. RC60d5 TaxID=3458414 RepID=UPI00403590CD